mmetsp:Transcript_6925/g.14316  ORF Transcript_6925/g.14316 Transcript_6925/m.14316 type:complete len:558 (-) Transcript_6925:329-2002(-)
MKMTDNGRRCWWFHLLFLIPIGVWGWSPLGLTWGSGSSAVVVKREGLGCRRKARLESGYDRGVAREDYLTGTPKGLVEEFQLFQRLSGAIGTVIELKGRGPLRSGATFHSERSGPLGRTYREAYAAVGDAQCGFEPWDQRCNVAIKGLGTVSIVGYDFFSRTENIHGHSVQTQIACQCLNKDCTKAVVIRPVDIWNGSVRVGRDCVYAWAPDNRSLLSCHIEMLNVQINQKDSLPRKSDPDVWEYIVNVSKDEWWSAVGYRGRDFNISEKEFHLLPSAVVNYDSPILNLKPMAQSQIQWIRSSNPGPESFTHSCSATSDWAKLGSSWIASQQDQYAIGLVDAVYLEPQPSLISDTELTLVASNAALGVIAGWFLLRKSERALQKADILSIRFQRHVAIFHYLGTLLAVIIVFLLEALPMQVALIQEVQGERWSTEILHVDLTVASSGDLLDSTLASRASNSSALVASIILGKARYIRTRVVLLSMLTALFNAVFLVRLIYHSVDRFLLLRAVRIYKFEENLLDGGPTVESLDTDRETLSQRSNEREEMKDGIDLSSP